MNWHRTKLRLLFLAVVALSTVVWLFSEPRWLPRSMTRATTRTTVEDNCSRLYKVHNSTARPFYLCKTFIGRLGNHLFQYASLYGIARSKSMIPMIEADDIINDVFDIWALKTKHKPACDGMKPHSEARSSAFDSSTVSFPNDEDRRLYGYLQSFLYFNKYEEELRCQFKFSAIVTNKAKQVLQQHLDRLPREVVTGATLVAVHIRRGDKLSVSQKRFGVTVAPLEYVRKAQQYFVQKYHRVVFVVCSDSMEWCVENLPGNNTVFIPGQTAVEDLALMSQCQHTITTVGTFSWWVAWLVNGHTVYYGRRFEPGSKLSRQWNLSHHYFPHWISME